MLVSGRWISVSGDWMKEKRRDELQEAGNMVPGQGTYSSDIKYVAQGIAEI